MLLFVCGGLYPEGLDKVFKMVRRTGGLPYVADGNYANMLYSFCAHHSSLYFVNDELTEARKYTGHDDDPERVQLTQDQANAIRESAKNLWTM